MALVPDRSGTDNLSQIELVFAWNFNLSALQKIAANAGAMSLLHGMSNMKTSPTRSFVHLLNGARKSRITVGLASITLGLVGFAEAATDFCQKTAQDALQGCQDSAQSAQADALGKCENISYPAARTDCRTQAAADFQDALQTCHDGYASRQAACQKFGPARYDPVIDPAKFVRHVTNPFFPLPAGQTFVYEGHTKDGFVHNDFIVTRKTKVILGVTCTEVHDVVFLDGVLAEDTLDWYAQDSQGNVWYFGENTEELIDGRPSTLAGTFTAGINNDKPGIVMEGNSLVRDFYRQEFALATAEDNALVVSLNATITVPRGTFTRCLKTLETTPLEPDARENKYYASGVGNVLTVDLQTGSKIKLVRIHPNNE